MTTEDIEHNNEYILYIAQDANFQSRSMLIPKNKLKEKRLNDINKLISLSECYDIKIGDKDVELKNVVTVNYLYDNNYNHETHCGSLSHDPKDKEKYTITNHLTGYADFRTESDFNNNEKMYYDIDDKEWYDDAICDFVGGFDHIKNYIEYQNMTDLDGKKINIVNSLLVLETQAGVFNISKFGTVKEMMDSLYK